MEEEVTPAPTQKKRGRPLKTSNARAVSEEQEEEKEAPSKKKQRKSTGGKAANGRRTSVAAADKDEEDEYADMKQWAEATTWEHLIESIDTVERTDDGELYVYFTLSAIHVVPAVCPILTVVSAAGNTTKATGGNGQIFARRRCPTRCVLLARQS